MAKGLPGNFWLMSTGSLLFFLSFNILLPELPEVLRKMGGQAYIGFILPAFAFSALLARPFSGWITDKLGRKHAMIGGALFCVVAGLLYPWANTLWLFFLIRFLHGFSTGFSPTGFTAFTTDIIQEERRGEALGWQGIFSNSGTAAGYALGASMVILWGQQGLFVASSVLAFLAILIFSFLPETKPQVEKTQPEGGLFYPKAMPPSLLMLLVCVPLGALLTVMPDYTAGLGYSNKGIFLTVYIGSSLLVRVFSGKLSDRLGRAAGIGIGTAFQVCALLLLFFETAFFPAAVLYGIGQGFNAPSLFAWAGDVSTPETRGRALSMLFIALETGIIIGGLGSGLILNLYKTGFYLVFGFCALASVFALAVAINQHKKSPLTRTL
ncbi:MAG: MFS transporter [Sphingomonadales bacterium]|nr:MFS transporter [Sphingomonadales bacterium]